MRIGGAAWLALALLGAAAPATGAGEHHWRPPPGAPAYAPELSAQLDGALGDQPLGTTSGKQPRFANRLALETSPYLARHGDDPVDWWPWGDEAFAAARRLNRPVFLSIGYLACGGCHAMETQCFENEAIARLLNERYVAILVDREERPEVEALFLDRLRALGVEPGWPMSLWLLPDGRVFFAGTFYPAEDSSAGLGFRSRLQLLADRFAQDPSRLESLAAQIAADQPQVPERASAPPEGQLTQALGGDLVEQIARRFDERQGGLLGAPKFPLDVPVRFLLGYDSLVGDPRARHMAIRTLEALAGSALRDPLSGGFHRYAVDGAWRRPHFEKMLADNALLAMAFLDGWRVTGRADLRTLVEETLDFLLEELGAPGGGFYAALDAVSPDGVEGGYYSWTKTELSHWLDERDQALAAQFWTPIQGERGILAPRRDDHQGGAWLAKLRQAREQRPRPAVDRQWVLYSNGLAISALAQAGRYLEQDRYLAAARQAALRVGTVGPPSEWRRLARADAPPATLADLAAMGNGLLDLFEATLDGRWLGAAHAVEAAIAGQFIGPAGLQGSRQAALPLGQRWLDLDDGLGPSGSALYLDLLRRLAPYQADPPLAERSARLRPRLAAAVAPAPGRSPDLLRALWLGDQAPLEILILVANHAGEARPFLAKLQGHLLPQAVTLVATGQQVRDLAGQAPLLEGKTARGGQTTAYLCRGFVCERPTSDPAEFAGQLTAVRP